MRTQFEAWITAPPIEASVARLGETAASWPGQYANYSTQLAWEAWQAASAALEVLQAGVEDCAQVVDELQTEVEQLRRDAERERAARKIVDEALRQAIEDARR